MPCYNKFKNDLSLDRVSFQPATLIVGTFQPEWPANTAEWFFGQTHNANGDKANIFWDLLPGIYGEPGLLDASPREWKQFCCEKQVALTNLISAIDDADSNNPEHNKVLASFADKALIFNFDDFEFVNIVQILKHHPSIKNVYLTRGITESFWRHLWNPVIQYCNANDIRERRLLPPMAQPLYQHEAYNSENPSHPIPLLQDYMLMRWQQEWHI